MEGDTSTKATIYYDGTCRVCSVFAETRQSDGYEIRDITVDAPPVGVSKEEAWKHMYVERADGTRLKGVDAVLSVLEHDHRWKWLARMGTMRALHPLAVFAYEVFARVRHRLPGNTIRNIE